jgi:hypothetical protein
MSQINIKLYDEKDFYCFESASGAKLQKHPQKS